MMDRGNEAMKSIIESLPSAVQTQIKAIHDEYKTKQDTLQTEEKTKIDAILAGYPEIKTKLDTMKTNHPENMKGQGFGKNHGKMNNKTTVTNNVQ
jgi:hypothetical protein